MKTELKKELDWGDFSDPTHDKIEHDYLPDYGEGKTKMSQAITASSKLIYRWFNDGDFFDARVDLPLDGEDLSSYANWLYKHIPETRDILDRVKDMFCGTGYIELLYDLYLTIYTQEMADKYAQQEKVDSIYDCDGPFSCEEESEEW